jgi:hypothetical protein
MATNSLSSQWLKEKLTSHKKLVQNLENSNEMGRIL